jgi:hypothetical protein
METGADYVREMVNDNWMEEMVPLIASGDEKLISLVFWYCNWY